MEARTGGAGTPVTTTTAIIEAGALTKTYGKVVAVDGLDLRTREGGVVGLLGPNGCVKTTTILMMPGLTEPTSGRIANVGFDPLRKPIEVKRRGGAACRAAKSMSGSPGQPSRRS